jgi:hypothetical protein
MEQNSDLLEKWKNVIIGCATTGVVLGRFKSFQFFFSFFGEFNLLKLIIIPHSVSFTN